MNKKQLPTKTYMMETDQFCDGSWTCVCERFSFNAIDQNDANRKAGRWNSYQGLGTGQTRAREMSAEEISKKSGYLANEYLK